ncbi:hypothetical protein QUH73_07535 [Labilibaculum sp. K2S]|uniref:hypothetical protein n=1 Tax=Labilibaculum sp. K2S TaxID=3056386 RepID=UPI0025A38A39|nr:hypothetical protein [Labilibaculum sp. K2S]MDM8159659.1 hypothetical protein [Labilibaculum sp. K2S]
MNYFLFGGARNTGKSKSVYKIADFLINTKGYTVRSGSFPVNYSEFRCIIVKDDKVILIQSYTDLVKMIIDLKRVRELNKDITHIITANRNESDYMRNRFRKMLNIASTDYIFEIPLGKVIAGKTRSANIVWYLNGVLRIAKEITNNVPFNF